MKPIARKENIVVKEVGKELFIYDLVIDKVYGLNETSAFVWNHLDGQTDAAELSLQLSEYFKQPLGEELVWLAIDELRKSNLLTEENLPKPLSKLKRREAIRKIGLASMIALPIVASLIAPTAAHAASSCPGPYGANSRFAFQFCTSSCQCQDSAIYCCLYNSVPKNKRCRPKAKAGTPNYGTCIAP